jgi:hypothetical protein
VILVKQPLGQNDSCGCFVLTQNNELEPVIIPNLFPIGKGVCVMFARMIVLRKSFCRAGILKAATMVLVLDLDTFVQTERAAKRKGAMANDRH